MGATPSGCEDRDGHPCHSLHKTLGYYVRDVRFFAKGGEGEEGNPATWIVEALCGQLLANRSHGGNRRGNPSGTNIRASMFRTRSYERYFRVGSMQIG